MSRRPSTKFGEPLSKVSLSLVSDVRRLVSLPIHPNFDTDFNIYRFVANAERTHRTRREVVESAAKALDKHLRVRNCMKLDELPDIPLDQNRLFRDRLMPLGRIMAECTDSNNRLLWFVEYESMSVEKIAHGIRSSESIRSQFWQFEHMIRMVNKQERRHGRLSSIRHVVDMAGYEINPFTALFVSSGTLSYYSQLLHYDNYPELVYPIELVNIAKWIHLPYRMIRGMMPAGFTDRFRLHDGNFLQTLTADIPVEHIPHTLGGMNQNYRCIPASPLLHHWQPGHPSILDTLECLHIGARKCKWIRVQIDDGDNVPKVKRRHLLSWYFRTDGDIFFGVLYEPNNNASIGENGQDENNFNGTSPNDHKDEMKEATNGSTNGHNGKMPMDEEPVEERLEWVYPLFKLSAKYHHEWDCVDCSRPGTYLLLFSNKHSWIHRRTVEVVVQLESEELEGGRQMGLMRVSTGAELKELQQRQQNIRESLQLSPDQMFGNRIDG